MTIFQRFTQNQSGAVAVETALVTVIMVALTAGVVEAGYAYHQHSTAQAAARHGARVAAIGDPVAKSVGRSDMGVWTFDISCSGETQICSRGDFDAGAHRRLVYGIDDDRTCAATIAERRGMCDLMADLSPEDVTVSYTSTGLGNGARGTRPSPLVTVTIERRPLNTVLIGGLFPSQFLTLPEVSASLMGEDMSHG